MAVAQKLYEQGHITYMRTDSVNLSQLVIGAAKAVICNTLGEKYSKPRNFATKTKGAQRGPRGHSPDLYGQGIDQWRQNEQQLYSLIRKRTLASQMAEAELEKTTITIAITGEKHTFEAVGEVIIFDGFLKVYMESFDDEKEDDETALLPAIHKRRPITTFPDPSLRTIHDASPRYTEASLVKKMETWGNRTSFNIRTHDYHNPEPGIYLTGKPGWYRTSTRPDRP